MSLFHFRAQPSKVSAPLKAEFGISRHQNDKPKYKNLMFDEHVFRGNTIGTSLTKTLDSTQENYQYTANMTSKFKENIANEQKTSCIDMKLQNRIQTKLKAQSKLPKSVKIKKCFLDETDDRRINQLVLTPRTDVNHAECATMTEEYIEYLTDKFPHKDADVQTEPLLSRAVKKEKILAQAGVDASTQIFTEDYLIDFDEQTESVIRVILNKVLEQSRMEVLEELEIEKMKAQKQESQKSKMRMLSTIQREKAKESRVQHEIEKRELQSKLNKESMVALHKKMACSTLARRMFHKIELETANNFKDLRQYLEYSEASVWTEVLPSLGEQVLEHLDKEQEHNAVVDKLFHESMVNLLTVHQYFIKPKINSFSN